MNKIVLAIAALLFCVSMHAQIQLPKLISNGMILQRNHIIKLWGWAKPYEKVTLVFKGNNYQAVTNLNGSWEMNVPAQSAGGPYNMVFKASNTIVVEDVLLGDVWVCAGQSNMELTMERVQDRYPDVIAKVNNDKIRQFEVPDRYDFMEADTDLSGGKWLSATTDHIRTFSAVGYFFADALYERYKVPIGIINTALGGSPAQAWLSEEALKQYPDYYNEALRYRDTNLIKEIESDDRKRSDDWYALLNRKDEGVPHHWSSTNFDDSEWKQMQVPGYWKDGPLGNMNGAVWFRKEINIPASMIGKSAKLLLGRIVDADSVFVNDAFVGNTTYLYPPRRYMLNRGILQTGKNIITIRVINTSGNGGFVLDKPYCLVVGADTIDLKGSWKYNKGAAMEPLPGQTFVRWKPLGLYNGMIAPITHLAIKGITWYQGEANVSKPEEYTSLMKTLIEDWRLKWKDSNLPFLYVQLANFQESRKQSMESNWAALRQAQLNILSVKNTGMAVAIDLGEWNDIHPLNKKELGHRLALQAMNVAYNDKRVVASGPIPERVTRDGNKLIVYFKEVGAGLVCKGTQSLNYFAIARSDGRYEWAKAIIKDNTVIIWNDKIQEPYMVRYSWADNPEGANLYNKEGLPATPFELRID